MLSNVEQHGDESYHRHIETMITYMRSYGSSESRRKNHEGECVVRGRGSGWWLSHPSEKWWSSSVGIIYIIPSIWKVIKVMFQTTNQGGWQGIVLWPNSPSNSEHHFTSPESTFEDPMSWLLKKIHGSSSMIFDGRWQGKHEIFELPSGNLLHSYWKWQFIVDFPIKNGNFQWLCNKLPEGKMMARMMGGCSKENLEKNQTFLRNIHHPPHPIPARNHVAGRTSRTKQQLRGPNVSNPRRPKCEPS